MLLTWRDWIGYRVPLNVTFFIVVQLTVLSVCCPSFVCCASHGVALFPWVDDVATFVLDVLLTVCVKVVVEGESSYSRISKNVGA